MEQLLVGQIVIGILIQAGMAAALAAWGRWVETRMGAKPMWRWARRGPWISFVLLLAGMLAGTWMLTRAFGSLSSVDPAHKAQRLADGISNAMNVTALFFAPGYLILFASVVMFIVGSLRAPR